MEDGVAGSRESRCIEAHRYLYAFALAIAFQDSKLAVEVGNGVFTPRFHDRYDFKTRLRIVYHQSGLSGTTPRSSVRIGSPFMRASSCSF